MMIGKIFGLATLGLASLIYSASGSENPKDPPKPQQRESEDFRSNIYKNLHKAFPYNYKIRSFENTSMIDDTIDALGKKYFSKEKGLSEFRMFLDKQNILTEPKGSYFFNLKQALLIKTLALQGERLKSAVAQNAKNLEAEDHKKQIEAIYELVDYKEHLSKIPSFYFEPYKEDSPKNFVSNGEINMAHEFVKLSVNEINEILLNNLSNVKVKVERLPVGVEHIIYDEAFYTNIKVLSKACKDSKEVRIKLLSIVDNRLKTEKDLRNRGMLYEALGIVLLNSTGNEIYPLLERLRDGITKEEPLVAEEIGGVLAEKIFRELTNGKKIPPVFRAREGEITRPEFIKEFTPRVKNLSEIIETARKGEVITSSKNPGHSLLTHIIAASGGRHDGLSYFVVDSLKYRPIGYGDNGSILAVTKDKKLVEINDDLRKIITNSNCALAGFGKRFLDKTSDEYEFAEIRHYLYDLKPMYGLDPNRVIELVIDSVEKNLHPRLINVNDAPFVAASLTKLYQKNENVNSEQKVKILNRKISFIFDCYEEIILRRCVEDYKKSFTKQEEFKETQCAYLWNIFDRTFPPRKEESRPWDQIQWFTFPTFHQMILPLALEQQYSEKRKSYEVTRGELHNELLKVSPRYGKLVVEKLHQAKVNFTGRFLDSAASRGRELNWQALHSPSGLLHGMNLETASSFLDEVEGKR